MIFCSGKTLEPVDACSRSCDGNGEESGGAFCKLNNGTESLTGGAALDAWVMGDSFWEAGSVLI
jgi:hypothetical protein